MRRLTAIAFALALGGAAGAAAAQDEEIQTVPVQGVKNPEMKSYRAIWKGLDKFDDEHELAPAVPRLKFRIMANKGKGQCIGVCNTTAVAVAGPGEQFGLRIASNDLSVPVPIGADGYFVVPRNEVLYDGNADLILNQKKGSYKMSVDVRTPGLPDNVRRLGDLRLECKVQVAIVKEEIPFWIVALANSILLSRDWCMASIGKDYANFSFFSPAEVVSAHLVDGERNIKLSTSKHSFNIKLGDKSWPDDALVKLEYAPETMVATAAPGAP
ncbi:hypothetical protein GCM10027321_13150 [Massilia terrae]|uniref:Uncharacterized protein n=1 Tax=Massilia terrae TaxID=1811224 RepID=A0ABT2CV42_9BURK|nr:hypothetical protein [Massilia terrae]MCS0657837.1 hypothetical protein [Massilia terrae]